MYIFHSMAELLASDGAIESSKLVISEALKSGPDLGQFLRGGSFAACAQVYRNLSSKFDYDAAFFSKTKSNSSPSVIRFIPKIYPKFRAIHVPRRVLFFISEEGEVPGEVMHV